MKLIWRRFASSGVSDHYRGFLTKMSVIDETHSNHDLISHYYYLTNFLLENNTTKPTHQLHSPLPLIRRFPQHTHHQLSTHSVRGGVSDRFGLFRWAKRPLCHDLDIPFSFFFLKKYVCLILYIYTYLIKYEIITMSWQG